MDKEVKYYNFSIPKHTNSLAIVLLNCFVLSWSSKQPMCNFCFSHITGDIVVDVVDEVAPDLSDFISSKTVATSSAPQIAGGGLVCENVTLSLDYKLYWNENGITSVILTRTVGTISIFNSGRYL